MERRKEEGDGASKGRKMEPPKRGRWSLQGDCKLAKLIPLPLAVKEERKGQFVERKKVEPPKRGRRSLQRSINWQLNIGVFI